MANSYNQSSDQYVAVDPYSSVVGGMGGGSGYVPTGGGTLLQQEGITKWLQSPDKIIKDISLKLRGMEWNKLTKRYEQVRSPMLSEEGITIVITTLDFHINRTITLSRLEESMINRITLSIMLSLSSALQQHWVRCGLFKDKLPEAVDQPGIQTIYLPNNYIIITRGHKVLRTIIPAFDSARFGLVIANVTNIIYANLMRAEGGGERNFLTKITSEQIQSVRRDVTDQKQDGGMLSKLTGFPSLFKK